jgi:hypothetical protein
MRYTKSEVRGMFSRLVRAMNRMENHGSYNGWVLDYAACYGGYVIEELGPEGGCNHPFSSTRRNAREMYLSMLMTAQGLENIKYQQEQAKRERTL